MQSKIVRRNGTLVLQINGQEYSFAATRSFRPKGRIIKDFSNHGLKFFNIFPSGIMTALNKRTVPYSAFGPVWVGDHQYNWDNLRAQCDEFFPNLAQDAYVSLSVHLDPPGWYVDSHPELRGLCPQTPGSIRYVAGRVSGKPVRLTSGIAIGRTASGFVDNTADHVWCSIDQDGYFKNGELIDRKQFRLVTLSVHPDTGEQLEGRIPHWEEIGKAVEQFCSHFPQLSYLGFDFVVTSDDRVKILEINSLSALDCFQNDRYGALESPAAAFFRSRLEKKN